MEIKPEDLFNPTKKIWDPFGEYNGQDSEDSEGKKEKSKPKDPIDRFVEQHGFFSRSNVEVLDSVTGRYVKYTGKNYGGQSSQSQQTDSRQTSIPEIRDGYNI